VVLTMSWRHLLVRHRKTNLTKGKYS
jgi:hypothetical protein